MIQLERMRRTGKRHAIHKTVCNKIAQISAEKSKKSCHLSLQAHGVLTPSVTREQVVGITGASHRFPIPTSILAYLPTGKT